MSSFPPENVYFTRDTHQENYLRTQEGQLLPVSHCIEGSSGWEILPELDAFRITAALDKPSFGSLELARKMQTLHEQSALRSITLIGVCTDICVISNALILKAALPEVEIRVDASACAGVSPQSHQNALDAMRVCQVNIVGAQ
ncbi:MAG: isochorismatase family protein, partial [Gallicola sp.]|nr:isochorismatase family protein [Gallicola sp.]